MMPGSKVQHDAPTLRLTGLYTLRARRLGRLRSGLQPLLHRGEQRVLPLPDMAKGGEIGDTGQALERRRGLSSASKRQGLSSRVPRAALSKRAGL